MFKLISLNTRMTKDDTHLDAYDHTKLSNVNTCPTWGILRYSHHKKMPGASRAMALEAGIAAHECFAAIRWYQYRYYQCKTATQEENAEMHGQRLFGKTRFDAMLQTIDPKATTRTNVINFALEALEQGDFYDDIGDIRRTISNISEGVIAYADAYDMERYPIWIRDPTDPFTDIGIEIAFDIVVDIEYEDDRGKHDMSVRFTGKLDGLQHDALRDDTLIIIDDKTGSRIDDNWLSQWMLSQQLTGYCLAATTFTGLECNNAQAWGMKLPVGNIAHESVRKEPVNRHPIMYNNWANWFVTSIETEQRWRDHIFDAPQYTHSCNRYFSVCSFLPFCAAHSIEEKKQIYEEMEYDEWTPLEEKV